MATICFLCTVLWAIFVAPTFAWNHVRRADRISQNEDRNLTATTAPYVFSLPSAEVILPSPTSQGMTVTSVVPVYEVCNVPGSNTTTCSTAFQTITTETCSTVLTYAFSKTTISECTHNVTFSTHTDVALSTTTLPVTGLQARDAFLVTPTSTTVTYAQSTVSYYAAPWQSLAADAPSGITVLVCVTDFYDTETCYLIEEVWVVRTEFVPVTTTSILTLSTFFSSVCSRDLPVLPRS